jgi:serine/threonine-protein kinase
MYPLNHPFRGLLLALTLTLSLQAQTITTVAGNTSWGRVNNVSIDSAGNLYAADYNNAVVWKTTPLGVTTVYAGTTGQPGFAGDSGPATSGKLNGPLSTAIAADGTLYIGDYNNDRIRKVSPVGIISTFAGTGVAGWTGDGAQASTARIYGPFSMTIDSKGALYFVDYANYRIRKITPDGVINTIAGSGKFTVSGDGGLATATDIFPGFVAVGSDGTVYFSDDGYPNLGSHRLRAVSPTTGMVSTIAGNKTSGFLGDGGPATAAELRSVDGVALDSSGNIYIADADGERIRKVAPNGIITTYAGTGSAGSAGDGGPAAMATFFGPTGLTQDAQDNLYVVDTNNKKIRKIAPVPIPSISSAGISPSFLGRSNFGSNMFVEIYGSNLAATSRGWASSDFNGANAPTKLDGVSVTVDGKAAYINYVSPGQVNINTPDDTAVGPVNIQVTNSYGVVSNVVTANRARVSPTLHTVPLFNVGGKQYVAAHTPDFSTFIGTPGMIAGVPFATAKPGDVVIIFALGCGATNPPVAAGTLAPQTSPLALPYTMLIGGVQAEVQFAGMIAGNVGLYQFNVVIPNLSPGDQTIELQVDGVSNAQNLYITVGQ